MTSQTRSSSKYGATYSLSTSEDTIVEITNYATGERKTSRRTAGPSSYRHDELEEAIQSGINQDSRFKTPSPKRTENAGPPKVDSQPRRKSRPLRYSGDDFFLGMPEQEVNDIMDAAGRNCSVLFDRFQKYVPQENISYGGFSPLGSPLQYALPLPLPDPRSPPVLDEGLVLSTSAGKASPLRNKTGSPSGHPSLSHGASRRRSALTKFDDKAESRLIRGSSCGL